MDSNFFKLEVLDLSRNQLTTLPSIATLTNLNKLDLSSNQLSALPSSISTLTNLAELVIDGNPLTSPPLEIAQQGIEAIKYYFESETNNRLTKLKISNKKVLLVGEGEVGKTSLFRSLKGASQSEVDERTKGVDVHFLELKNGIISIWDFAGQEDFFSSHNIFTKDNNGSLFLVVFRLNDADDIIRHTIKKWTSVALEQSPQSDIVLVGTHLDEVRDTEGQKKFIKVTITGIEQSVRERVKNILYISNETKKGIEEIKAYIDDQIQQEFNLPIECVEVFEQIKEFKEKQKKEYIYTNEIIIEILAYILNIALTFFHSVGEIIRFTDNDNSVNNTNKNANEIIILNPDWLSKQMATLIQEGKRHAPEGWISTLACYGIWDIDENIGKQLTSIMHQVKLIYFNNLNNEVLVNQLLPPNSNDIIDEPIKYGRIWQFNDVIPMGLFEHLHFKLLELKLFDIEAWKNCLKVEQGVSSALIQILGDGKHAFSPQLRVITWGEENTALTMKIMVEIVEGLLKEEFNNSKFIRRVYCVCEQCVTNKNNIKFTHWPLSDEDKLDNEKGKRSILSRNDATIRCNISKASLPLDKNTIREES